MSWLDLSSKIDAFKRELDGIDEAVSHAMHDRAALQAWNVSKRTCTTACCCFQSNAADTPEFECMQ
jgi:hypothetical protein